MKGTDFIYHMLSTLKHPTTDYISQVIAGLELPTEELSH